MDVGALRTIPELLPTASVIILHRQKRRLTLVFPESTGDGLSQKSFRECSQSDICGLLKSAQIPYRIQPGKSGLTIFQPIHVLNPKVPTGFPSLREILEMPWTTATLSTAFGIVTIICMPHGAGSSAEFSFSCSRAELTEALRDSEQIYTERSIPRGLLLFISSNP